MMDTKTQERNMRVLEMDKVLASLAEEATMADAAQKALELKPCSIREDVETLLQETADAHMFWPALARLPLVRHRI